MNVRFQKTARGEVAILPRKEYEALVVKAAEADEDAGTARLVARARRRDRRRRSIAAEASGRSLGQRRESGAGLREWRDVTQLHLSFKTNLSQGYISDVETGRRKGAAAALRRIADALKVPLDLLVFGLIRPAACVSADAHARSTPPVRLPTSATIFAASASISASVMVRSRGWIVTAMAIDFLPGSMPVPS